MNWLPRSQSRIRAEAADWVARRGGGFDDGDADAFARWYADESNAAAYNRLAAIWATAARVRPDASAPIQPPPLPSRPLGRALIASLIATIAVVGALLLGGGAASRGEQPLLLASAVGEIAPYRLADGSRVILDSSSKVEIDYSAGKRRITLRSGRAQFEPAEDRRPFEVDVDGALVATGKGAFVLSLIGDPTAHLLRGELTLAREGSRVQRARLTRAGQMVRMRTGRASEPIKASPADLSWSRGMLDFDGTPLRDAIALANRYSDKRIRLADPSPGDLAVTGAFRAGDTPAFARSLAVAFGLRLERLPDGNLLLSRAAGTAGTKP